MADTRFRAGSSKQLLWAAYSEQGKDAAYKLAKSEGIPDTSANIYIREFEKMGVAPSSSSRTREVFDIGDPQKIGHVITEGKEVSEVQWPGGAKQFIPNDKLLPKDFFNNDTKGCYKNAKKFAVMDGNKRVDLTDSLKIATRRCVGNPMMHVYAITGAGLVRLIPRSVWKTYPNIA